MSSPPIFDAGLPAEYERRLRDQGIPLEEWDRPGLSEGEIERTLAPLGLELPAEARVWWGWHNGSPYGGPRKLLAPTGQKALSLAEAADVYSEFREIALSLVEPDIPELADPDARFHPAWFPLFGPQLPIVVDCSTPLGRPTPLRFVDLQNIEGTPRPRAESLGQMVSWWIGAIDSGGWRWDTEQHLWREDPSLIDPAYRVSPLV